MRFRALLLLASVLFVTGEARAASSGQNPAQNGLCSYPPVTTPLSGTECFPLNQNGVTKTANTSAFFRNAIQGPGATTVGDAAIWNNTSGTALADAGAPPTLRFPTTAALQATPTSLIASGFTVMRTGYYAEGDAPSALYTLSGSACSLRAGNGDGGSQIPTSNPRGKCWLLEARSSYDVRLWGAVGDISSTTGTVGTGGSSLTVASTLGYSAGQPIDIYGAGAPFTLNPITGLSVTTEGTTGSTQYCAYIVAIDADHGYGPAVGPICNSGNGNSALQVPDSGTDAQDQLIQWTAPVTTGATSYAVYDNALGSYACRAVTTQTLWRDYGQSDGCPSWLPQTTPPSGARADLYRGTVTQAGGSTIQVAPSVTTGVTNAVVMHDDTVPIQSALDSVANTYLPCESFHLTQGLTIDKVNGQSMRGANKECTFLIPDGTFDVLTLTTTGWTAPPAPFLESLTAGDFAINAMGMASGYATTIYHATRSRLDHIAVISSYNELLAQDSFIGDVTNFYSFSRRRGDVGFHLVGSGSGGNPGQQLTNFDFLLVNSASSFQGISFHINGNVAATRARHFGMQVSPYQMVINNAIGAGQVSTYFQGYDVGFNVCWRLCLNVATGTLSQFFSPYIQQVSAGGANPEAILLAAVDAVAVPSTGSLGTQFYGGTIFGGDVAIKDNGTGTVISGSNVFTSLGRTAAIECTSLSTGLSVTGGNSYTLTSNLPEGQAKYGVLLDTGCTRPTVLGDWIGTIAGVQNDASPGSDVTINGQFNPPPTSSVTGGSSTLTVASFPNLYTGVPGYVPNLEVSGSVGTPTFTTDTAAAIIASLTSPYVGQPIWFNVRNHDHNSMTPAVITIAGGAGVTISGTATVPDSGGSGMYTSRMFKGVVTNVGAPAITLKGCTNVAGAAC